MSATEERQRWAAGMLVTPTVRLVAPLGAGGMGAVWVAEHTGLRTKVVVKFMHDELDESDSARSRFSREASAAAQVKSPHVVQMLDHGVTDDGAPFIVMEYLEGRNLGEVLRERGALPPAEVVAIVTQVARALSRVHAADLLHRDVKPENIFLCDGDGEPFVKLLDFGIVKSNRDAVDTQTKTGQVVGTPFYMSPEQMMGQKEIDARSDLWSLGVVVYECLTGKRPFDGPSFGAVAVNIATGAPMPPSEVSSAVPVAVDAWFQRACARSPEGRFASAKELAEGLREAFGGAATAPASVSSMAAWGESKPERALAPTVAEGTNPDGVRLGGTNAGLAAAGETTPGAAPNLAASREAIGLAKTEFGIEGGLAKSARPSSKAGVFVAALSLVVGATGAVFFLAHRSAEGGEVSVAQGEAAPRAGRTAASTARDPSEKRASSESKSAAANDERALPASAAERSSSSSPPRVATKADASVPDASADAAPALPAIDAGETVAPPQDAGAAPPVALPAPTTAKGAEPEPAPESSDAAAPDPHRDAAAKSW